MEIADHGQPDEPPRLQAFAVSPPGLGAFDEKDQAGPEQQAQQRAHLAFEQHHCGSKGELVRRARCAVPPWGQGGGHWPRKAFDVDREDAEDGHAPDQVERGNSFLRRAHDLISFARVRR